MAPNARNERDAKRLWTLSAQLVGVGENCNMLSFDDNANALDAHGL